MNQCPEIVQQATEGNNGIALIVIALLVVGVLYVWKKGLLGTANEGRIKAIIAKLEHDAEEWKAKLEAKVAQKPAAAPVKTKAERLAEAKALLGEGDAYNQAAARIASEP